LLEHRPLRKRARSGRAHRGIRGKRREAVASKRSCHIALKAIPALRAATALQQANGASPVRQAFDPAALFELPQQAMDTGFGAPAERYAQLFNAGHRPLLRLMGFNRVETLTLRRREAGTGRRGIP
jgi:hypothetical protein